MKHKFYYWKTLTSPISFFAFENYEHLKKELEIHELPQFKDNEILESVLGMDVNRTIYAYPIKEYGQMFLEWYENMNVARKNRDWHYTQSQTLIRKKTKQKNKKTRK